MHKALKGVFKRKAVLPQEKPVLPGLAQSPHAIRTEVPKKPMAPQYLEEFRKQFLLMGIVRQAAYVQLKTTGRISYLMALDLEVDRSQEQEALDLIAASLYPYDQAPFKGSHPVDFTLWDESMVQAVLKKAPELQFFKK